jgi:hypothetical protein
MTASEDNRTCVVYNHALELIDYEEVRKPEHFLTWSPSLEPPPPGPLLSLLTSSLSLSHPTFPHHPPLQAWSWQKHLVQHAGDSHSTSGTSQDRLLLLQHHPVYTLGTGSTPAHLRFDPSAPPLPLHRTERGGEVTYHGPGQLVMYPVLNLRNHQQDLHWYLRQLEEVVIRALDNVSMPVYRKSAAPTTTENMF